ncbi:MAG: LPS export ABC transporter periplasmic protein LptC [Flavobacteriales bacterium]|nr:LPS export ABC transporter periplasmic protein LptC [Flavobacteriales bacterium]|tara:strand:- start:678 stop:1214 length:537 start_codon:yes stop_codon:yes gene_type:complete
MLFICSCQSDLDQLNKNGIEITGTVPDAYYTNFNIIYSDSGILKVKITGHILEQYSKGKDKPGKDIMRDSVHVRFYNQNQIVSSELFADYAVRNNGTNEMNALGNVVVINSKKEKLNTERLTWNSQTKKIICDTTVVITKPNGQKIVGNSLESDEKFEDYRITKVSGELPFKREETPK